jgi:ribonuclease T2
LGYGVSMKQIGAVGIFILALLGLGGAYLFANPHFSAQLSAPFNERDTLPQGKGFDFYVLALSWSPTYCQDPQARQRDVVQCSGPQPFAFVVHGLWPQFEQGYPRACQSQARRPTPSQARAMLDIMPSERLVQNQWDSHGTCTGLSAAEYLTVVRAAAAKVKVPDNYASAPDWRRINAGDVEAAFMTANSGMSEGGIGVVRRGNLLSEVRICMTRDLTPRTCPEVDSRGAGPKTRLSMPPSRH